ncbi:MAG: porphobilinogen deaminase [Icmadophila ericetorum]|nr:porphobilinogen deaminase [Icmadophila ericetorum]
MAAEDPPPPTQFLSSTSTSETLRIGTRSSPLAIVQANHIHSLITAQNPSLPLSIYSTASNPADVDKETALYAFNAKSLWTSELEADLVLGKIDLIVHSLKDMPTQLATGCALGAVVGRSESRDCVVMSKKLEVKGKKRLEDLQAGDVVGTSSVRRQAQLRRKFPHLAIKDMRGNVGTRLRKLDAEDGEFASLIMAAAGVERLGLGDRVSGYLSRKEGDWYNAVGQGALGVEIREGDEKVGPIVKKLMEGSMGQRDLWECLAERSCLRTLEGGCSVPIGVETEWTDTSSEANGHSSETRASTLLIHARVVSLEGDKTVTGSHQQVVASVEDADEAGWKMAQKLVEGGAAKILEPIIINRRIIAEQNGA